jgi:hypothetical protein
MDGNKVLLEFLADQIQSDTESKDGFNISSDKTLLISTTLKLVLTIAELGPTHKKALGMIGVFSIILST